MALTPELPEMLAEFALQEVVVPNRFAAFWAHMTLDLPASDRDMLVKWFRSMGTFLTGHETEFPELET